MAHLSRLLGKVAETVVFAYLGMSAFIGQHTSVPTHACCPRFQTFFLIFVQVAPRLHHHHHRRHSHRPRPERVPHRVAAQPPRAPAAVLAGADRHVVQRAPRRHFLLSRHERAVGISSSAVHTGSRARDHRVLRGWHNAVRAVIHVLRLREHSVTCRQVHGC